ncbi:MAG: hypothetical protein AAEJ52_09400, partial [Myxococcota bacterium]
MALLVGLLSLLLSAPAARAHPDLVVHSSDISCVSKNGVTGPFNQAVVGDVVTISMSVSNAADGSIAIGVSGTIYIALGYSEINLGTFSIPQINPGEKLPVTIIPNTLLPTPPVPLADAGNGDAGFEWTVTSPSLWLHVLVIEIVSSEPPDSNPLNDAASRGLLVTTSFAPPSSDCEMTIVEPSVEAPWTADVPGGLVLQISDSAGVQLDPGGVQHLVAFFLRTDGSNAQAAEPLNFLGDQPLYLRDGQFGGAELVTIPASEAGQSVSIQPMAILPTGGSCSSELVIQINSAPAAALPAL